MKICTLPSLLLAGALALPAAAQAEDSVVREHSFDLSGVRELIIEGGVGSMRIRPAEGNELRLVLNIEGQNRGWFRSRKDVSGVELESRRQGDRLLLIQDERDTNTDWTVEMPVVPYLDLNLGVGEIDAEVGASEVAANVGVGEIRIEAPQASAGSVHISTGVGDARLRGAEDVDDHRAFVSKDVRGYGQGELRIDVKVGVGDAAVSLR